MVMSSAAFSHFSVAHSSFSRVSLNRLVWRLTGRCVHCVLMLLLLGFFFVSSVLCRAQCVVVYRALAHPTIFDPQMRFICDTDCSLSRSHMYLHIVSEEYIFFPLEPSVLCSVAWGGNYNSTCTMWRRSRDCVETRENWIDNCAGKAPTADRWIVFACAIRIIYHFWPKIYSPVFVYCYHGIWIRTPCVHSKRSIQHQFGYCIIRFK